MWGLRILVWLFGLWVGVWDFGVQGGVLRGSGPGSKFVEFRCRVQSWGFVAGGSE